MKKHGGLWWLCIGWWWLPVKWICYSLPESIIRKTRKSTQISADPQPTEQKELKSEPYVYITTKGKKFHYTRLCPTLRNAKEIRMDLSKARKAGYTACDKCCYDYLHE